MSNQPRKRAATKAPSAPSPPAPAEPDQNKVAAWLMSMSTKTDMELVAAYAELAQERPFIHQAHVVRILKLATLGLGSDDD